MRIADPQPSLRIPENAVNEIAGQSRRFIVGRKLLPEVFANPAAGSPEPVIAGIVSDDASHVVVAQAFIFRQPGEAFALYVVYEKG